MSEHKHASGLYIFRCGDELFIDDCNGRGTWTGFGYQSKLRDGELLVGPVTEKQILSCVNACAGMADPVAEVQALREALLSIDEAQLTREQVQKSLTALGIDTTEAMAKLRTVLGDKT